MRSLFAKATRPLRDLLSSGGSTGEKTDTTALQAHYDRLEATYLNANVYDSLTRAAQEGTEQRKDLAKLRSLRNPTHGVVEFYARRLVLDSWLEDLEAADGLKAAIGLAWEASNLPSMGRPMVRQFVTLGDLFVKVSHREDADGVPTDVFYEQIDPRCITDFEKDGRGFLRYLRIDVPKTRRNLDGETEPYTLTEVWDKETGLHRRWEHDKGSGVKLSELGNPEPDDVTVMAEAPDGSQNGYAGYDFIPVVHRKCRDVGFDRGLCVFAHALPDIMETDRVAVKLFETVFPDVLWIAASTGVGLDGKPLPAPVFQDDTLGEGQGWGRGHEGHRPEDEGYTSVGNDKLARLPGGYTLEPKIPDRNLSALIDTLDRQVTWVEGKLPEAVYGPKLRELELSGAAMEVSLLDVTDAYREVGGNLADGLQQANKMALSIGQALGLEGFGVEQIGTFGAGNFDHTFELPPPFPKVEEEPTAQSAFDRILGNPAGG